MMRTDKGLEQYGHGGDLLTAAWQYGLKPDQFIDFSSNMNPWGPPSVVRDIIADYASSIASYPDPATRMLKRKLSIRYRIAEDSLCVGNGAAELIDLTVRMLRPQAVALMRPSFSEYEQAVVKTGGRIVDIPLYEQHRFQLRKDDLWRAADEADVFILGHPNNPTGQLLARDWLLELADAGKTVVVDEAFIDFTPQEDAFSLIETASHHPNVIVLRSMTKFYSVPGIRLGFMAAHPDRIQETLALQVPWSVNSLAQLIGEAVIEDEAFADKTRRWLQSERPWLAERLTALGIKVAPSDTNYLLLTLPEVCTVQSLQRRLGERGVLVRDGSRFPGLNDAHCRVAVRTREDNRLLLAELERELTKRDRECT